MSIQYTVLYVPPASSVIILEAALELYYILKLSVSVIWSILIDIKGLVKMIETPVSVTQYSSAAPQTTSQLNHLSKTV